MVETSFSSIGIDTQDDYEKAKEFYSLLSGK
jgi:CMP-2-keto-3-deoxyoctulosonic acid synthetase